MKRIFLTTGVLTGIVLVGLTVSIWTTGAAGPRVIADTGVIDPGPEQTARLSIAVADTAAEDVGTIQIRILSYSDMCVEGGVCRREVVHEYRTPVIRFVDREATTADLYGHGTHGVRAIVLADSSGPTFVVTGLIVNQVGGVDDLWPVTSR